MVPQRIVRHNALTAREVEIVGLVATGHDCADIAGGLGISERTVEAHVTSARLKLGARNRAHLAAIAAWSGLIDPSGQAIP